MYYKFLLIFLACISPAWGDTFCHQIASYSEFEHYSKVVDSERFTKCVLDLQQDKLYYFDVNSYPMHVDFINNELFETPVTYDEYVKNYCEVKPNFLFCYLIHHINANLWTFALWEGDRATKEDITKGYQFLSTSFFLADTLHFRPMSTYQEAVAKTLSNIPVVTNDELFRSSTYQLLHAASSVGILRIATNGTQHQWQDDEIIVLPELIPDVTPVAGIITEQFSSPLSHLALRARSWKIPHAGIKEASSLFREFDSKYVFFQATSSGYELRLATQNELQEYQNSRKKPVPIVLEKANLAEQKIKPLKELRRIHKSAYGTKAANLGECTQLKVAIPEGFAIPFYYYDKHIRDSGAYKLMPHCDLNAIQSTILMHPLDKGLLDAVWQLLPHPGAFVRSSTNAEDLPGFSGAGLYDTIPHVKTIEELERAIKTVWASVWNQKAYKERERYGIDHTAVYGAILVQASVDASSAGVLVTKDIFDPTEEMEVYTINAQRGLGTSVVDGNLLPEQITYNFDNKGIKIVSRASGGHITVCDENGGTKTIPYPHGQDPVLSDDNITALGLATWHIKRLFRAQYPLDIEWLYKDNTLYIVQVRPFTL